MLPNGQIWFPTNELWVREHGVSQGVPGDNRSCESEINHPRRLQTLFPADVFGGGRNPSENHHVALDWYVDDEPRPKRKERKMFSGNRVREQLEEVLGEFRTKWEVLELLELPNIPQITFLSYRYQ